MMYKKILYNGNPCKLEIFTEKDKLFKSLIVHKEGLNASLRLPTIYLIERKENKFYKYSEWIEGNTIHSEMEDKPDLIERICMELGRYVNELYNKKIVVVDSHFKNFVWNNNKVICIDLKKLLYKNYEEHVIQMCKICLKSCKGDEKKTLNFLKGYSEYRNVLPIIKECEKRQWKWKNMKGIYTETTPISLEDFN